ncbi:hypothetical protein ACSLVQ_28575, partial [Klebsiella pneumoniae]|uniref:hypothetical protein n=1 Tax=Klebsiella pneumoniae TaxID=573 RepID=UPI003EE06274
RIFIRAIPRENRMRVRIHEAGKGDAATGVNHIATVRDESFDFSARAGGYNPASIHKDGAVFDHAEFTEFQACARTRRSR